MFGLISTRFASWFAPVQTKSASTAEKDSSRDASEAILNALHNSNAVIQFATDGTVLEVNERFLQTMGYTREEIIGQHHRMFVSPQYAASVEYEQFWASLRSGQFQSGQYLRIAKDGREVHIQASYNPVLGSDGKPIKIIKLANDVTERVQALHQAQRLQAMIENLPLNVMFADRDLVIRYVNPASQATLKKIAHLLPVAIDKVVGSNIDVFHERPDHQRQLLSDPANLPLTANFQLGPEVIQLNVSAIFDREGNYIGPMACWSIETERSQIRAQVGTLAEVGNTVAGNVGEMAAAMDEIGTRICRNAELAEDTNRDVEDAGKSIHQLVLSSQEIDGIVATIQELAEQTNLLALNATIESARAGEAGRGFAVVANEVKSLANSTSAATKNIAQRVQHIRDNITSVVTTNEHITSSVAEVNQNSNAVAAAVEQQSAIVQGMKQTADHLVHLADDLKKL